MSVGGACVRRRSASIAGVITKPRHRIHPTFQVNAGFKRYYIKALSIDSKGKVNQALGKAQALKFETEFGKYKLKRGPYANDNYWDLDASVKPPHMWWLDYGSGLLGKIGQGAHRSRAGAKQRSGTGSSTRTSSQRNATGWASSRWILTRTMLKTRWRLTRRPAPSWRS